jgi:hypothetical protein
MATHFVYKEILSNKYLCQGKAVAFEPLDGNAGVAVFQDGRDDELLACLRHAASVHQGGIVIITEAQYEELKKNRPWNESEQRLNRERLRVMPFKAQGPKEPGVVADDVAQAVKEAGATARSESPQFKAKFQELTTPPAEASDPAPPPTPTLGTGEIPTAAPKFKPATKRIPKEKAVV